MRPAGFVEWAGAEWIVGDGRAQERMFSVVGNGDATTTH